MFGAACSTLVVGPTIVSNPFPHSRQVSTPIGTESERFGLRLLVFRHSERLMTSGRTKEPWTTLSLAICLAMVGPLRAASGADQPDQSINAQSSLSALSLEQLGEIQVTTASKEPETVWRTPAAIFVLTRDDLRRSGATTIPEVLRLVPGVEVARIDSDHWSVGIRGFGSGFSKSLLVLIDGRSVYTPLFAGVYWDVQDLPMQDIDRIEVVRGPGGTIWGSNAVDGVINIITKSAKDTQS
jgi:outer membrane cobalamin receptor